MTIPRLTIHFRKRKLAKTYPQTTLGEYDNVHETIEIFLTPLYLRASIIASTCHLTRKAALAELMTLTVFHELHHAMFGQASRELAADNFAVKAFKAAFGREARTASHFKHLR